MLAEEKEMSLKLKLKSTSQVAVQFEEKLSVAVQAISEKGKQHTHEMEVAARRTEEALKTLQVNDITKRERAACLSFEYHFFLPYREDLYKSILYIHC